MEPCQECLGREWQQASLCPIAQGVWPRAHHLVRRVRGGVATTSGTSLNFSFSVHTVVVIKSGVKGVGTSKLLRTVVDAEPRLHRGFLASVGQGPQRLHHKSKGSQAENAINMPDTAEHYGRALPP